MSWRWRFWLPVPYEFVGERKKVTFAATIPFGMTASEIDFDALGQLMGAAQQGDSVAYIELLRTVTPTIRQMAQRHRGFAGREAVEDIVQEVLMSVHQARASYDSSRPFFPWLAAIVRNRLADGARRYSRKEAREIPMDPADVTFSDLEANTDIDESGEAESLHAAVCDLPEGQRQAIELLKLKEMSLKEVSAMTGTSESALKVATHRAIATLRKKLGTEPQ